MLQSRQPRQIDRAATKLLHCLAVYAHVQQSTHMFSSLHTSSAIHTHVQQSTHIFSNPHTCPAVYTHLQQSTRMSSSLHTCSAVHTHVEQSTHKFSSLQIWFAIWTANQRPLRTAKKRCELSFSQQTFLDFFEITCRPVEKSNLLGNQESVGSFKL